jgi:hypothetical protein
MMLGCNILVGVHILQLLVITRDTRRKARTAKHFWFLCSRPWILNSYTNLKKNAGNANILNLLFRVLQHTLEEFLTTDLQPIITLFFVFTREKFYFPYPTTDFFTIISSTYHKYTQVSR